MRDFRKALILFSFLLLSASAHSQWINSVQLSPVFPSANDTLYFYTDLSFPSGSCDQHEQGFAINGAEIFAYATHCLGMLTFICSHTDTFKLNPLAAGNYSFIFQLNAGSLPFPCTPGIVPGPADTLHFTVNPANEVGNPADRNRFAIFPIPSCGMVNIRDSQSDPGTYQGRFFLTGYAGNFIREMSLNSTADAFDISDLENGIYFLLSDSQGKINYPPQKIILMH